MKDKKLDKLKAALEDIKREIEEHNLDADVVKKKPKKVKKVSGSSAKNKAREEKLARMAARKNKLARMKARKEKLKNKKPTKKPAAKQKYNLLDPLKKSSSAPKKKRATKKKEKKANLFLSKKVEKKEKNNTGYTVGDMADDLEMIIEDLRVILRKFKIKKPGTRWVWKNKTNSPLQEVKKIVREIAKEKKLKVKDSVVKKKKGKKKRK